MAGIAMTAAATAPINLIRIPFSRPAPAAVWRAEAKPLRVLRLRLRLRSAVLRVHDRDVRRPAGAVADQTGLATGGHCRVARSVERPGVALHVPDRAVRVVARRAHRNR